MTCVSRNAFSLHTTLFLFIALMTTMLVGCGPRVITKDRTVSVNVPVLAPCVDGDRPSAVPSLKLRFSDEQWAAMDVRQKAAAVSDNAINLRGYGEELNAATGACP